MRAVDKFKVIGNRAVILTLVPNTFRDSVRSLIVGINTSCNNNDNNNINTVTFIIDITPSNLQQSGRRWPSRPVLRSLHPFPHRLPLQQPKRKRNVSELRKVRHRHSGLRVAVSDGRGAHRSRRFQHHGPSLGSFSR